MGEIREQALLLGHRKSLVAILSHAVGRPASCDRPMVVILNAGIIHRVGPSRMNVLLARVLAASGYSSLRFDLSGLGDSDARSDDLNPLDSTLADIREVLDWLESNRGVRRAILIGLCSGANHALVYGSTDPRVVGLVLLDPAIPKTMGYHIRYYGRRLFEPRVLVNVLRRWRSNGLSFRKRVFENMPVEAQPQGPNLQSPEVRNFLERAYLRCLDHSAQFLLVLTKGLEGQHNYREQVLHAFPNVAFGDRIQLEYLKDSEHTFTSEVDRMRLFRLIVDWVERTSSSPEPVVQVENR